MTVPDGRCVNTVVMIRARSGSLILYSRRVSLSARTYRMRFSRSSAFTRSASAPSKISFAMRSRAAVSYPADQE